MWDFTQKDLGTNTFQFKIQQEGKILSFGQVIELLKYSDDFIRFYASILQNCRFNAFFWEVKPVTTATLDHDFEFVLVESSILSSIQANKSAFSSYLNNDKRVVTFQNLGKDAQLIVPNLVVEEQHYAHMASFIRNAPEEQLLAFWKLVASEYESLIGQQTKWLSTAGLGVYWLHVRIDSRPKYYRYAPYKLQ